MIIFDVQNARTSIRGADQGALHVLDVVLRYSTQVADLRELGIELPGTAWDGWVRFLHVPRTMLPWFPTGLLSQAYWALAQRGYQVGIEDQRVRPERDVSEAHVQISLRDYQLEAVERAVARGRGVIDCPPRSGKTRMLAEVQRRLALPTIWIAPTDRIVVQTQNVLEGFFGPNYAIHLVGSAAGEEAATARVVLATAASAGRFPREFYATRQMIVIDEWHHGAAKTYREIFNRCDHIYYRYGMTGTFFRSGDDAMAMHALLSETIYRVDAGELLRRGYLVPTYVAFVPVTAPRLRGVPNSFQSGHGKYGIHEHEFRNQMVADIARYLWQSGRRVLILVGTKKQGRILVQRLRRMLPQSGKARQFAAVEFVSTDVDRSLQGKILDSFERGAEVQILIGTTLLGEGVDLPTADALVYARGEQAAVSLTQAVYRVGTAAGSKTHSILVDFADRHSRKLLEHSLARLRVYHAEPTFQVSVLEDLRDFPAWLSSVGTIYERANENAAG